MTSALDEALKALERARNLLNKAACHGLDESQGLSQERRAAKLSEEIERFLSEITLAAFARLSRSHSAKKGEGGR